jgi:hypothetical protein
MFYFLGVTVQRVIKFITQRVPGSRDWIPQFFAETVRAYNPHTYKHILHLQATENNSLGELFYLCSILDHNTLMGSIPRAIGKLQNLTVLNLSTNQLMGPIPSEIGDMRKISTMYCLKSYDQLLFLSTFNFEVHNPSVGLCPRDLHANRLNGDIPPELGKLTNLVELRLSNNSLTGTIPGSNDSVM